MQALALDFVRPRRLLRADVEPAPGAGSLSAKKGSSDAVSETLTANDRHSSHFADFQS